MAGPLHGLTVVEMAGIGPAPFACYLLAGLGAAVTRIEAKDRGAVFLPLKADTNPDIVMRDIRRIDLKTDDGHGEAIALIAAADVVVEGFRPGVMERLGLGPDAMLETNPALIYGRMTGYGQDGPMAARAGHDLNYIALSGVLSMIGRDGERPTPPLNLVGDYGGGSMMLIMGILAALFARQQTGRGCVVDTSMVEGAALLATPIFSMIASGLWQGGRRGRNLLDGGCPFYDTYETADGRYVAVAPLEPQFFAALVERLGLDEGWTKRQYDRSGWDEMRVLLTTTFRTRSRDDWAAHFADSDACVTPVLTPQETAAHPHNRERGSFRAVADQVMPALGPRFSDQTTDR